MTGSPEEYRKLAYDLRKLAADKEKPLGRRAKLVILAEQFEELARDVERVDWRQREVSVPAW